MKHHPFHCQQPHFNSRLRYHVSSHCIACFSGDNIIRAGINTEFWFDLGNAPATYTYTISQSHADFSFLVPLRLVSIMNSCTRQCAGHFLIPTPHKMPQIYRPESLYTVFQLRLSWEHCPATTIGTRQPGNTMALIQLPVTPADPTREKVLSKVRHKLLDSCRTMKSQHGELHSTIVLTYDWSLTSCW